MDYDKTEQRKGFRGRHPDAWARGKVVAHIALALWFAYFAWGSIAGTFTDWPNHLDVIGIDGRLYYRAACTFVAGGDPWTAAHTFTNTWPASPDGAHIAFNFTGPPPTVLAFVPFVWIPEWLFVIGWMGLTIAAAVYTVRRLHLPIYWLLFPPMVQGVLVANPQVVCLALLLCSSSWLRALAAPMKAYAVIPMVSERQWRALAILAAAGLVSRVVFWPLWHQYIADYAGVQKWLFDFGAGHSASASGPLWIAGATALICLVLFNHRAVGWLAVPILWPAAEYFYATFIMPLRSPCLAAAVACAQAGVYLPGHIHMLSTAQVLVLYTAIMAVRAPLGWLGLPRLAKYIARAARAERPTDADRPAWADDQGGVVRRIDPVSPSR
jgi:hypothetical protein